MELRLSRAEKAAFEKAASRAGLGLSDWIRTRARHAAQTELGEPVNGSTPLPEGH